MPLYAGQHADIQITQPSERATTLVEQLLAVVNTSAPSTDEGAGRVRVHLTQADADAGAESIRKLADRIDPEWATLITITAVREMP